LYNDNLNSFDQYDRVMNALADEIQRAERSGDTAALNEAIRRENRAVAGIRARMRDSADTNYSLSVALGSRG
jgi:hypothetical protein